MKISFNPVKTISLASLMLASSVVYSGVSHAQNSTQDTLTCSIPPEGTRNKAILESAPSPDINIAGKIKTASIVVDLSKNVLYKYDKLGKPEAAYLVASGKRSTPTHTGVRVVSHIEKYPYKTAYGTKRKRDPNSYGPYILILDKVNPQTGETCMYGEFIHGHDSIKSPDCLGKYVSHGCVRMDNNIITQLATQEIKSGDIVIIKR